MRIACLILLGFISLSSRALAQPDGLPRSEILRAIEEIAEEFYQIGAKALEEGRVEQAEGYFDRTLILKPEHKGAREGIEAVLRSYETISGEGEPAEQKPRSVVDGLKSDLEKRLADGDLDGALSTVEEILAIEPSDPVAKRRHALINKKLYERAVARAADRESKGDYQGAIDALWVAQNYRKYPSLRPRIQALRGKLAEQNYQRSDELYLQALTAHQEGKEEEALKFCRQALDLNPKNHQANRMMERLKP